MGAMKEQAIGIAEEKIAKAAELLEADKNDLWDVVDQYCDESGDDWMAVAGTVKAIADNGFESMVEVFEDLDGVTVDREELTIELPLKKGFKKIFQHSSKSNLICDIMLALLRIKKEMSVMTIKEMRTLLGVSRAEFSRRYKIPIRTLESWESGDRTPPAYVVELLGRAVKSDIDEMRAKFND